MSDLINVIQRWESLGLLEGLPIWEKEELSQVYDNATRLLLSERSLKKIPKEIFEIYDDTYIPICRRLYRRVGINFDVTKMMSDLLEKINSSDINFFKFDKNKPEKNPIVEFCVNFADSYEDEQTSTNVLGDEVYIEKVDNLISFLRKILLDKRMVSFVNREESEWKIIHTEGEKSNQQVRYWNQKIAKQLLTSVLSDINKGI